jgi:hypothetical protein
LSRAREKLRARLTSRGLAPAVAALAATSGDALSAVPPAVLVGVTARVVGGQAVATSGRVTALAQGVLQAMWMTKVKTAALAGVMALGVLTAGTGLLVHRAPAEEQQGEDKGGRKPPPAAPGGGKEVADLAKARLEAARAVHELMMREVRSGHGSLVDIWKWSPHLLEAELDAAATKAERVAARLAHVGRMRDYEKYWENVLKAGRTSAADMAQVRLLRAEAELRLAQEKAK